MFVLIFSAIIMACIGGTYSDCCYDACHSTQPIFGHPTRSINVCADCTRGTPYCAYGKCNAFGCNCDNGCRQGNCQERASCLSKMDELVRQDLQG
uniref:Uncharacterized protein n=1 Tax=Romanomermis culicivorax TaxID=13658 RepID=A0A915KNY1_ROMCU